MAKETNNKYEVMAESSVNVQTDAVYQADAERVAGVITGVARSILYNTAARQNSKIAVAIANFMARKNPLTDIDTVLTTEEIDALLEDSIKDAAASGPGSQVITVTYVSLGRYVANITPYVFNDQNKLTLKFVGTVPSADLELPAKVSVDNGVIDYPVKLKDTLNVINVGAVKDQIADIFRNSADVIINRTFPVSKLLTFDSIMNSTYGLGKPIKGISELVEARGMLLNNSIVGGDFTDAADWAGIAGTLSVSNNILTYEVTATTTTARIEMEPDLYASAIGDKYFLYIKGTFKYANNTYLYLGAGTTAGFTPVANTPTEIYGIVTTADTTNPFRLYHRTDTNYIVTDTYTVDGTAGVFAIRMTDTVVENYTEAQMLDLVRAGYFEGIDYITDFELSTIGVNLFDGELENGNIDSSGNNVAGTTRLRIINYIDVVELEDYYFKINNLLQNSNTLVFNFIYYYDNNNNFISNESMSAVTTLEIPSGTRKIRLTFKYSNGAVIDINELVDENIQIEQGTSATAYAKFNSPETNFKLIDFNGKSVGTDVYDKAYYLNGKWWKDAYVGYDYNDVVQDTTTWAITWILTTTHTFYKILSTLDYVWPSASSLHNTLLKIGNITFTPKIRTGFDTLDEENTYSIASDGNILIAVNKTTYADTAAFEAYLQANDVTFVYELNDIVTTELEKEGSLIQESNTTMIQHGIFATNYTMKFALNKDSSLLMVIDKTISLQQEVDKLQEHISILYDQDYTVSIVPAPDDNNVIILNDNPNDYDKILALWWVSPNAIWVQIPQNPSDGSIPTGTPCEPRVIGFDAPMPYGQFKARESTPENSIELYNSVTFNTNSTSGGTTLPGTVVKKIIGIKYL